MGCLLRYLHPAPFLSNRWLQSCAEAQATVREGVPLLFDIATPYMNEIKIKTNMLAQFFFVCKHFCEIAQVRQSTMITSSKLALLLPT